MSDRKQTNDQLGADQTVSGGQAVEVAAFYEANVNKLTFGGALSYTARAASKTAIADAAATSDGNNTTGFAFTYYMPVHFTPTITLLPVVSVGSTHYPTASGIDSQTALAIGCAGRFAF